ncbi:hypothetical protein [Streptomyces spongiae]|uniref:hypothetical protein n=1 Tax=Streptomyces spongiae TaxID=565072 RepID=UPI0018837E85|nr:hypothetical protein [Streptomyces spongiae]
MERAGAVFLTVFGLVWWLMGASAVGSPLWPVAALVGCAIAAGVWRAGRRPGKSRSEPPPPAVRRRFAWINALQWLAIVLVAMGARAGGVPELIPGLVSVIVGTHFLPLAALFRQPRFHLTGALLIAAGAAGCAIGLTGGPVSTVQLTVGLAAALILWGTASLGRPKETDDAPHSSGTEHTSTP